MRKKNILRAHAKQKAAYNQSHCHPEIFRVGAMVLKKDFNRKKRKGGKLDPKWEGLYEIVCSLGHGLYCPRDVHHPQKIVDMCQWCAREKYILPSNVSVYIALYLYTI